ncbi:uncharacterized protein BP01DRAFT_402111 [Aspergillus saccharolyticus JOP 1030-1]|uniref:Serine hydrolase domain-containing protein n=1 Tax=Aspergillus saccharolyticus JOP 1030-1 TaxID=1450539 RepID=A0A318Z8U9_9EURO|nr:hypothetical protein BP01DRAFT_402111 [Aspergillus saccharolyticus JOP 1030-1]PYH43771.1 hypothetical protein BP01DRAFT_402111 [Aspergillus saccharolyticus JOP 1030-1]
MRILCLHGYGTNPASMKQQLAGLRQHAPPHWEFIFLRGGIECLPAVGLDRKFPGPFNCYARCMSPTETSEAYTLLDHTIRTQGPFDGVIGFSHGAALALSYLLESFAAQGVPSTAYPFRFAVFFSSIFACAADPAFVDTLYPDLRLEDWAKVRSCEYAQFATLPERVRTVTTALSRLLDCVHPITQASRAFFLDRPVEETPLLLDPEVVVTRLGIPTLHVWGENEPRGLRVASQWAVRLCERELARTLVHGNGHDVPRGVGELRGVVGFMEEMGGERVRAVL